MKFSLGDHVPLHRNNSWLLLTYLNQVSSELKYSTQKHAMVFTLLKVSVYKRIYQPYMRASNSKELDSNSLEKFQPLLGFEPQTLPV